MGGPLCFGRGGVDYPAHVSPTRRANHRAGTPAHPLTTPPQATTGGDDAHSHPPAASSHEPRTRRMSGPRSTAAWQKARAECLRRSQTCWLCGEPIDMTLRNPHPYSATVDHVIPLKEGGALLDPTNLRPAHRRCNIVRENDRRKGGGTNPSRRW